MAIYCGSQVRPFQFPTGILEGMLAAQLYSIHKIFWKKPAWCLAGLKAAGFDGVEFAGYANHTAKEIRALLGDAGMLGMGTHVNGFVDLKGDGLKKTLDFCAEASPLLQQQVDTSNAFNVIGAELIPLLRKYRGRHYSVHFKENVPSKTARLGERPTDGAPCVPWREVLDTLSAEDVAWHVIEAETVPDSIEPLADSLKFLKELEA